MQNMPRLQRLDLSHNQLDAEAFQPGLRSNRTSKQLVLSYGQLEDSGIRLIVDALVGNAAIEILDISYNLVTSVGLADITPIIKNSLTRNQQLTCVNLLLAPPPRQQQHQEHRNAAIMMLKILHKAIAQFAMVPNNTGASAIFKLFQARPQLLEKRIKRPSSAPATADASVAVDSLDCNTNNSILQASSTAGATYYQPFKRQRL